MSDKLVKKCLKNSNFALLCDPFCLAGFNG